MERQHIPVTAQQRDQYRDCSQTADRARDRARDLAQAAKAQGFGAEQANQERDRLRDEVGQMLRQHDRLMTSMSEDQRLSLRNRTRDMEQAGDRVRQKLQELDRECARDTADPERIARRAETLDKEMKGWQKQFGKLGSDLGIEPEAQSR